MRITGSIVADGTTIQLNQGGNATTISAGSPAGDITITLPAVTSTLATTGGTETLTGKTIDGDDNTVQDLPLTAIKTELTDADKVLVRDASGVPTSALVVNANISDTAAIALTKLATVTADRVLVSDGSGNITAASVTATVLGYLDATSSVQTQLNAKQDTVTGAATTIVDDDLTADKVLVSDGDGKVSASSVSTTTLGYLDATSSVQTQLNAKQDEDTTLTALAAYNTNGLVTQTDADTFTGRTITGTANRITVTNGDGVSGNPTLDIGSDVVTKTGSQELTNKTITLPTITSPTITTPTFGLDGGGLPSEVFFNSTSGRKVLVSAPATMTDSVVGIYLPTAKPTANNQVVKVSSGGQLSFGGVEGGNSAGDIVTTDDTQTLTNKTITSPTVATPVIDDYLDINEETAPGTPDAGKLRVYAKDDHKLYTKNSDGIEQPVGSGAGGGSSDFFYDDFEDGTVGSWVSYKGADSAVPVDGTGGSPLSISVSVTSSSPLDGVYSLLITKSGPDGRGEGVSRDFTVPSGHQVSGKKRIAFLWDCTHADYTAGDFACYIYDVTNGVMITPSYTALPKAKTPIELSWDASTASTYRLIFHCTTVTAASYTAKVDDITVDPGKVVNGVAMSEWQSYTPVLSASSGSPAVGNGTLTGYYSRQGDTLKGQVRLVVGSTTNLGTSGIYFSIPSGLTIDTSKVPSAAARLTAFGASMLLDSGTAYYSAATVYNSPTTVTAVTHNAGAPVHSTSPFTWATGDSMSVEFTVPIAEWAGGSAYLGQSDTQECVIASQNTNTGSISLGTMTQIPMSTEHVDTANCFASGVFTARTSGYFRIAASALLTPGTSITRAFLAACVGGTEVARLDDVSGSWSSATYVGLSGSATVKLNAGDTLDVRVYGLGTGTFTVFGDSSGSHTRVSIERVSVDGSVIGFGAATATSMGLTKQNRIQSKSSASSYGSNASGIITFSNLTIGRTYRITAGVVRAIRAASGGYAYVEAKHNSSSLFDGYGAGVADAGSTTESAEVVTGVSRSAVFVAAATSVSIDAVVSSGSIEMAFATLEELNNYEVTTDW